MNTSDRFRPWLLKKSTSLGIDLLSDEVVVGRVSNVELDRRVERDEFYQVGLAFTVFLRQAVFGNGLK